MAGEQIEIVIDANGLARTEQVFKSVDKYLDRIYRRVDKLGRMRVTPMVRLTDRVTPQLEKINRALNRMTGQIRRITIVPVFKFEALAMFSLQLETALKAALELKAALDFKSDINIKAALDIKAALKAAASIKATLNTALNLKASLKLKAFLTVFVKGIFKGICMPCLPGKGKPKNKNNPAKQKPDKSQTKSNRSNRDSKGPLNQSDNAKGKNQSKPPKSPKVPKNPKTPKLPKFGGMKIPIPKMFKSSLKLPNLSKSPKLPKLPKPPGVGGLLGKVANGAKSVTGSKVMKGVGKVGKLAGKAIRPLGMITDAVSIFGASPGKERNKAIRSAAGGWAGAAAGAATGAAIGSIIPGVGTAIGGLIGGALGGLGGSAIAENIGSIGKKIGGASKKIGGWLGLGKKKKEEAVALPTPSTPDQLPQIAVAASLQGSATGSNAVNVNLPTGAVQLTVNGTELNYEEISSIIGSKVATSIRQAMENRT